MQNFKKRSKTFNIKIFLNYETQILRLNFKYQIFNPPAISPTHPKPLQQKKILSKTSQAPTQSSHYQPENNLTKQVDSKCCLKLSKDNQ